jgi:small-conductance mechanosensitive channel
MFGITQMDWVTYVIFPIVIIVAAAIVGEGLSFLLRGVARRAGARARTLRSIGDGMRVLWILVAALGIASVTQIASEFTVLTIGGIGGLVVSLALQTTLANVIAGVLLLRDRAIRIDDVIEYSGVKGRVVRVALRNTWVITDKGTVAIIGNSALQGGPLINHTASEGFAKEYNT